MPASIRMSIVVACATLTAACSSAPSVYGTRARFSPAFQGYVMAEDNGSDDPGEGDAVVLLRDPLTGAKLRCRDDVEAFRELHEDLATDAVHDENTALAVGLTTGTIFGPLVALQPVGAAVLAESMLTTGLLYDAFDSEDAVELLAAGIALYDRHRYVQAGTLIERALAKNPGVGLYDKAYLYLGLAYLGQKKHERAALALSMFIDRAGVRDIDAYRLAASTLARLGVERPRCASVAPVELHW